MNFKPRRFRGDWSLVELLLVIMIVGILAALVLPCYGQNFTNVYQPNFYKVYSFTTANTNQVLTPAFSDTLRQNSGESIFIDLVATNTTAALSTNIFDITVDGTHWTSNGVFQFTLALNGTTHVQLYTNIASLYLNNARAIKLTSFGNGHTNSITGLIEFSHSNQ